jgi:hypothetical protein
MSAIFELPIESETLTPDEIIQITGCQAAAPCASARGVDAVLSPTKASVAKVI